MPQTIEEVIDALLENRDIKDRPEFLHPTSPLDLSLADVGIDPLQVEKAVKRLLVAKEKNESIIIYGDYDCDGISATTVLWETLHTLGMKALPFIPDRERHGYGLSKKGLDEILEKGKPDIVISVDNGIVAHAQWQRLKELGVFTILTDHHEPDGKKLVTDCVVHTTKLCGTTVAWMFAREIEKAVNNKSQALEIEKKLDLAAIATIADQVPLIGANRSFAVYGLEQLNRTSRLGLELLIEASALEKGKIDTYGVNFGLAPRINAMGRISSAMDALRALCTKDRAKAAKLISSLNDTNTVRQDLTQEMLQLALSQQESWKEEHIIIVAHEDFHEGVIGLIAGKLTETFHKPAIAFALGKETAKGSARSVRGVHITNLLRSIQDDLMEVGGHPLAAGLKIETIKLELVRNRIQTLARETIDIKLLEPSYDVESRLPGALVTLDSAEKISKLSPFGSGNPEPLFLYESWTISDVKPIGRESRHLKFVLSNATAASQITVLFWNRGDRILEFTLGSMIDFIGQLQINEWKGNKKIQIVMRDYRLSSD